METLANLSASDEKDPLMKLTVTVFGILTTLSVGEYVIRHWPKFTEFQMVVSSTLMFILVALPLRVIWLAKQRNQAPSPLPVALVAYCCLMLFWLLVNRT